MAKGGFRGGYPGGGQMNMMKQAQKMQQEFMKMQQELESTKSTPRRSIPTTWKCFRI